MEQHDDLVVRALDRLEKKLDKVAEHVVQGVAKTEEHEARIYKCEERLDPVEERLSQIRGAIGLVALFGLGTLLTWAIKLLGQ